MDYNKVDWNNTFLNSDEVRGWGIRYLRERHRKDFTKKRDKAYLIGAFGTLLLTVGVSMMIDGFEKGGKYQGILNTISEAVDRESFETAANEGYKILK